MSRMLPQLGQLRWNLARRKLTSIGHLFEFLLYGWPLISKQKVDSSICKIRLQPGIAENLFQSLRMGTPGGHEDYVCACVRLNEFRFAIHALGGNRNRRGLGCRSRGIRIATQESQEET